MFALYIDLELDYSLIPDSRPHQAQRSESLDEAVATEPGAPALMAEGFEKWLSVLARANPQQHLNRLKFCVRYMDLTRIGYMDHKYLLSVDPGSCLSLESDLYLQALLNKKLVEAKCQPHD